MSPRSAGPRNRAEAVEMVVSHLIGSLNCYLDDIEMDSFTDAQVARMEAASDEVASRLARMGGRGKEKS